MSVRGFDDVILADEADFRRGKRAMQAAKKRAKQKRAADRVKAIAEAHRLVDEVPPLRLGGMTDAERVEWRAQLVKTIRVRNGCLSTSVAASLKVSI